MTGVGKMKGRVVCLTLCLLIVASAAAANAIGEKARMGSELSLSRQLRTCGRFCQEMAAITIYSGPDGATSLSTDDHEVAFSAYVVDRKIALTAGSAFQNLLDSYSEDQIRVCHVHRAKPVGGMWRSCGKVRRVVFPSNYAGNSEPNDIAIIKIGGGNLGAIRFDPDLISFGPINFDSTAYMYGYGSRRETEIKKHYWQGDSRKGFDSECGFTSNKGRYLCVLGARRHEYYKMRDEGGLFIYELTLGENDWKVGGIITNDGEDGDIARVLRFDKPRVQQFIRKTVMNMKGELQE